MRAEEQLGGLHVLARRVWAAAPTVRVHYDRDDDALVAEIVQAPAVDEVLVLDQLLVEFDGADDDALPTTLYLTGIRAAPHAPAVDLAREVLGEEVWAVVRALVDGGTGPADVELEAEQADELYSSWQGLPARLRECARGQERVIGVEFGSGRVRAVLTDRDASVLDDVTVVLDRDDPAAVVEAIARATCELARRHPGTQAEHCEIGVQLGGPVDPATGVVEYYDKPLRDVVLPESNDTWKDVPLGQLLAERTGRRTRVFNDAFAFAANEVEHGIGRELARVAVLVVGQGVGAKLIHHAVVVDDFPMEIGVFVPVPDVDLAETPTDRARQSIEAESGVLAIVEAVQAATGRPCTSIEDAAQLAEYSWLAEEVFWNAGAGLARMMAAAQAIVNPQAWVLHGPPGLVDERPGGRAFRSALARAQTHLDYSGFLPGRIEVRSTEGSLGARAAAVAALSSGRTWATAQRNGGA